MLKTTELEYVNMRNRVHGRLHIVVESKAKIAVVDPGWLRGPLTYYLAYFLPKTAWK